MSAINTHIIVEAAVRANGKWVEITEYITKFSHILSNVEASSASITLNSEHMNYKLDDFQYLATGQLIVFRYGYLNQEGIMEEYNLSQAMSKRYQAIIGDINYQYGSQGSKFILKLISVGYLTRKITTEKIWKNVRASDIAFEIARIHNLKPFIDETSFVYGSLPQGNKSNYDLLRTLAQTEKSFIFFVRSNELHFKKVGTYKAPIYRIDVRGAIVTDLNLVWQEIEETKKLGSLFTDEDGKFSTRDTINNLKSVGETLLSTINKLVISDNGLFNGNIVEQTKETVKGEMEAAAKKNGTADDGKAPDLSKEGDGDLVSGILDEVFTSVDGTVNAVMTVAEKAVAQLENSTQKELATVSNMLKVKRKELTADVTLVGVPYLVNDTKVILENIHSRFEGSYYVEEVTHRIEESFMTSLRLNKHGIRRNDDPDPGRREEGNDTPINSEEKVTTMTGYEADLEVSDNGEYVGNNVKFTENTVVEESLPDSEK